jgi:hypothetical protein
MRCGLCAKYRRSRSLLKSMLRATSSSRCPG